MKNLPFILAVVPLVIAVWALVDAQTTLSRMEEFGLGPGSEAVTAFVADFWLRL